MKAPILIIIEKHALMGFTLVKPSVVYFYFGKTSGFSQPSFSRYITLRFQLLLLRTAPHNYYYSFDGCQQPLTDITLYHYESFSDD